ncbi:MAG: enoyl-CoA hydratase, partial [Miltoncostaeaceae bacterium]
VATLTLARPERRNPLSLALIGELSAALGRIASDEEIRAVVLAAEGPAFSAGHDLKEMVGREPAFYEELFSACGELMMTLHRIPQPVIAAVQGIATAAGCQLVAAADLAVASEQARFATPGVRIGLFCTTPMVEVARNLPRKRAMEMLLTGEPIDAETALDWGLVNRVVPADELAGAADALARRVADASAVALGLGKSAFYESLGMNGDVYAHASAVMCRNMLADDAGEGITAFLEKRSPEWSHR